MRLTKLKVAGFRGFAREQVIDLDADVILLSGPNGSGKTSLLDAIMWCLTGKIRRLGSESDLVSKYSEFGEARAELSLTGDFGSWTITRRFDGTSQLLVEVGERRHTGASAEAFLVERLWPDAKLSTNPDDTLVDSITTALYFQQDTVRSFIESEDERHSRFQIVSELIGSGRVAELIRQLELSRRAWTTGTNRLDEEVQPLRARRDSIQARIVALGSSASTDYSPEVQRFRRTSAVVLGDTDYTSGSDTPIELVEAVLREVRRQQREIETRETQLVRLVGLLRNLAPDPTPEYERFQRHLVIEEREWASASEALGHAQKEVEERRRRLVTDQESAKSNAALARLALRDLGPTCPVCQQLHDVDATRQHLEQLIPSE